MDRPQKVCVYCGASGKLPPISRRLPESVFVVGPDVLLQKEYMSWENRQYGGEIKLAATSGGGGSAASESQIERQANTLLPV
ncbi:MAG: hypothetical protein ABI901_09990 [Roseiflexaceae bacterium]